LAALPVTLAVALAVLPSPSARAQGSAGVAGEVVAKVTGRPVAGALVRLPDLGLSARSGADGRFAFDRPIAVDGALVRVTAVVTAPSWGRWTISGAPVSAGDTLLLHAALTKAPFDDRVLSPAERGTPARPLPRQSLTSNTCTGWDYQLVPPPTIKVFRHVTGAVEQYDFQFYVQHVLPDEWISSWDADALGAGAVAARTYAAYRAMTGHAYSGGSGCADIRDDSYDQVFDPSWSTAATNMAVDATFGSILYRDGGLFLAQYYSGSKTDPCAPVTGTYAGRMSQWGTQNCATEGDLWPAIVDVFYANTTWYYQGNLLLNPGADSAATYPWVAVANTAYQRVSGSAYAGSWYLSVSPTGTGNAIVRQQRPIVAVAATTYHAEGALRCPASSKTDCAVSMRVVAVQNGGLTRTAIRSITVPNDGKWRLYTFDPPASGIPHGTVWLSFVSLKAFDLDAALLRTAFGGP